MINLAFLKANKWLVIIVLLAIVYGVYMSLIKLEDLIHPNTDKEVASISKARAVQIDNLTKENKDMHDIVIKNIESNNVSSTVVNDFIKKESNNSISIANIKLESELKHQILDEKINKITKIDTSKVRNTNAVKIVIEHYKKIKKLEDKSAENDIDTLYDTYSVLTRSTK